MEQALFGRQTELALVSKVLDAVPAGPVALILGGEPGTGKSALWLEALSQAEARSYRVLSCRPSEAEAKLSCAAIGDLFGGVSDESLEGLPMPQRSAIAVALLRAEAIGSPPDQRAISAAFHGALLALAAAAPTVVAIDDAQWLDAPSARVLEFVVRRLNDVPVGLIMTARSEELEAPPLGLGLGRTLLRQGIELEPGMALPVPSNLADLVKVRSSELSDEVRQVLLIVSSASQPTIPLVARAIGVRTAQDQIDAAFEAGVIHVSGGRLQPVLPLLATVLYAGSSGRARRDIHRRIAAVVVDQEERARHLALAAEGPDEEVAAELENAARRARSRGAPDAAAELSELARELTPPEPAIARIHRTVHAGQYAFEAADMGQASTLLEEAVEAAPSGPFRAEALLFLARVRYHSHDALAALTLAEQALAEPEQDPALATQIQLELAATAEAVGDRDRARAHARLAVDLAEAQGDEASLAESLALVGFHDFLAGEGLARSVMSRAIALEGARMDLRPLRSPTFREACMLLWTDELDASRSTFSDLEKRCRETGDEGSLAVILFLLAQLECWAGDWSKASGHADESCTITGFPGQQPYRALALSARALVEGHLGRTAVAREAAEEGLELGRQSGLVQASQFNLAALGFLEVSLGNMKEAHRLLGPLTEGVLDAGLGEPGVLRFVPDEVEALVALGEIDKARSILEPFLARAYTLGRSWALATAERGWGLLAASRGELPAALAAFDRAMEAHALR